MLFVRTQIITALVAASAAGFGSMLTLAGTTWQARIAARSKRQELDQAKEQARTQLYVDHVGQRLENRRATYIEFMGTVSKLTQLTREDAVTAAQRGRRLNEYTVQLLVACGEIETARNSVMIDGPQAVARQAAEVCRIPYRLATAVTEVCGEPLGSEPHRLALEAAVEMRSDLLRELTRFSVMASAALNLDGVGNHLDVFQTPPSPPAAT